MGALLQWALLKNNPFLKAPFFRETRDGRRVVTLNFYPESHQRALNFFRCTESAGLVEPALIAL